MRSDARKRLHPEPLPHHEPAVVDLIEAAREQGRIEGRNAHAQAIREDARRAAGVDQ